VEILRFGPGFRPSRPLGTQGLEAGTVWADPRARITDLAFARHARLGPQTSPDQGLFVVVAGGGWVQVADERSAINHGEAVEWPAGLSHAAWTDGIPMRALLVELPGLVIESRAGRPDDEFDLEDADGAADPHLARGALAERPARPEEHDPAEGEPW
jgi:quercetin dioxygenase-like cupin family protein